MAGRTRRKKSLIILLTERPRYYFAFSSIAFFLIVAWIFFVLPYSRNRTSTKCIRRNRSSQLIRSLVLS